MILAERERLRRTGRVRIVSSCVLIQLAVAAYLLGVAPDRIARMTGRAGHREA